MLYSFIAYIILERTPVSFGPGVFLLIGDLMTKTKPFKTHNELIALLEERGIDFSSSESKSFAKKNLQRIGYYNLINGYSSVFLEPGMVDFYKKGTTIEEIYNVYNFDQKLREIFLKNILPFETNIKSLVAYYFPQSHPETHYLTYQNFDTTQKDSDKSIMELIAEIQRQIAGRVSDPSISHYLTKYGYIPLWVLNNILTLGTISKFYSLMKQPERQQISKTFLLSDKELGNVLMYLSSIRNFCAHGNRLYCFRSKRPLFDSKLHKDIELPLTYNGEYQYGKRDLFAAAIALKLTLSKVDYRRFVKDIDIAIKNLSSRLNTIAIDIILDNMGFPNNWKELLLKQL